MTKQELNRDIKRLWKESLKPMTPYEATQKEYKRLFYADRGLEYMNKESIKIMLVLNSQYRFIPLHTFSLNISLK